MDEVGLDEVVFAAGGNRRVGRVVDLVVRVDVRLASAPEGDGGGIGDPDVVDAAVGDGVAHAVELDAAGARVVDLALLDAEAAARPLLDPVAADIGERQAGQAAILRVEKLNRTVEVPCAEPARPQRGRGHQERQAADRHVPDGRLLRPFEAEERFHRRRDGLGLRHVLARERPVDGLARRAVEVPLGPAPSSPGARSSRYGRSGSPPHSPCISRRRLLGLDQFQRPAAPVCSEISPDGFNGQRHIEKNGVAPV